MKAKIRSIARRGYAIAALALASVGLMPLLPMLESHVLAYGQVTTRSIEMSSSVVGNTNTSYLVTFTPATTATTIQGVVVDFCSNNPLIGNSCTAPTGFTVGTPTVTGFSITGQSGGTWTAASANSGRTLEITNGTSTGTPSGAASFTLTTATNPTSAAGTFYARIFTFAATADVTTWAGTANGSSTTNVVDAGGVAMSTTVSIAITANVMEQITFCTSASTITGTCTGTTTPTITIGHGSGTLAIDSTAVDETPAYTQVSTNASNGVKVRMKSSNSCSSSSTNGGLSKDGGTTCQIPGVNCPASCGTAHTMAAGTAAFGMCVVTGANTTAAAPYHDTVNACPNTFNASSVYGMDGGNLTTTYGSLIYSTTIPVNQEANQLNFLATAALTTPAGVYTVNENLIATGTF